MAKMRSIHRLLVTLTAVLTMAAISFAADKPASRLRLQFPETGVVVSPDAPGASARSLQLTLAGVSFDGRFSAVGSSRTATSGARVEYDFAAARLAYVDTPSGLAQTMTIAGPVHRGRPGVPVEVGVEFTVGGNLTPVRAGYFIKFVSSSGDAPLRLGPAYAQDADGTPLLAQLELVSDNTGSVTGVRVVVDAVGPAYPIQVDTAVTSTAREQEEAPAQVAGEIVGVPVTLQPGITETIEQIMEREKLSPPPLLARPHATHHELEADLELKDDPNAPEPLSNWPPIPQTLSASTSAVVGPPNLPQTVGTSFKGIGLSESNSIPPDSMGDVGATQILMHENGRIKVFNKTGTVGSLNVSATSFWNSVAGSGGISDPQVRYDRLTGRWFVVAITLESSNNKIVLAVSGANTTLTSTSSFTFYQFNIGTPAPGDASSFCDYPGFGVDMNALYVGCNMFAGGFRWASAFVIKKSSVTSGGPIVVTGFTNIGSGSSAGPYSPRGVDNDDPGATDGFIIGTDPGFGNRINIRKVFTPGGVPTLGSTITLAVSNTSILGQLSSGTTQLIDSSDIRLFAASIHKNKLTGVVSLWTSQSVETSATCAPSNSGGARRLGAKWYEIGNLSGTPSVTRFGTLCTTGAGSGTANSERGFLYPTVVETGQGHMALAASYASSTEFVGVAAAGRLRTDFASGTRAPETIVLAGLNSYENLDGTRNRWGDYSFTDVDPTDDQTVWTFQEYADTNANNWAVRAVQLKAPAPPAIASPPAPICLGRSATSVTYTGTDNCQSPTCTNGLCTGGGPCPEFFDPGPDTGGPGYLKHLSAVVGGGVTVNSASIVLPGSPGLQRVLSVQLSLNTTSATAGNKVVTITNPDGQQTQSTITVLANNPPVSRPGGPYSSCENGSATLDGTGSSDPDTTCSDSIASFEWDLNNDGTFDVTGPNPTVTWAQLMGLGLVIGPNTIVLRVTDTHGVTNSASSTLTISAEGMSCSDGNGCTQTDTCQSGTCVGSNPVTCTASDQCHVVGVCDTGTGQCSNPAADNGTQCDDGSACTQTDSCQLGQCVGANPIDCSDSDPCTSDICDPGTGHCSNPTAPDGTGCNDGDACTLTDSCQSGQCVGTNPKVCTPSDGCHTAGVCDSATGLCSNPQADDGTGCNDGNGCTLTDTCHSGACVGSNPKVCSALDQCHVAGVCDSATGLCSNPPAQNGVQCNDQNLCTLTDSCQSGVCTGTNPVVCNDGNPCTSDACDPGTGQCESAMLPDNTTCDDLNGTTCGDVCTNGNCAGHPVAQPPEIDNSVRLAKSPTDSTITWTDSPGPYSVYRGSHAGGTPWAYNHTCLAPDVSGMSATDTGVPSAGSFFYYLVTRLSECRESIPGADSHSNPIPNASPCPNP